MVIQITITVNTYSNNYLEADLFLDSNQIQHLHRWDKRSRKALSRTDADNCLEDRGLPGWPWPPDAQVGPKVNGLY